MQSMASAAASAAVIYAPDGQKPLSVARVRDRALLFAAAEEAIREAEATANGLMADDPLLGALHLEEAIKLRRVIGMLLPKREGSRPKPVM
jgi:hypothetical protein